MALQAHSADHGQDERLITLLTNPGCVCIRIMKTNPLTARKIQYGDIIVQFNGKKVESVDGLFKYLTEETIGMPARIGVLRAGRLTEEIIIPEPSAN